MPMTCPHPTDHSFTGLYGDITAPDGSFHAAEHDGALVIDTTKALTQVVIHQGDTGRTVVYDPAVHHASIAVAAGPYTFDVCKADTVVTTTTSSTTTTTPTTTAVPPSTTTVVVTSAPTTVLDSQTVTIATTTTTALRHSPPTLPNTGTGMTNLGIGAGLSVTFGLILLVAGMQKRRSS